MTIRDERRKNEFLWVNNEPAQTNAFHFKATVIWKTNSQQFILHSFAAARCFMTIAMTNAKLTNRMKSEKKEAQ